MYNHIIIHHKEIALKGNNRSFFERKLLENIASKISKTNYKSIERIDGRILISFDGEIQDEAREKLKCIFGIAHFSPVVVTESNLDEIKKSAIEIFGRDGMSTFAVRTKRSDKKFKKTSEEMNKIIGKEILDRVGGRVDLKSPNIILSIEITKDRTFLSTEKIAGLGGLPSEISGKVVALLSGGIDSPVAAWRIMKRGAETIFLHFHSYPHTNKASIEKVKRLAGVLGKYQPKSVLYLVSLGEAQRQIMMQTSPKYRVLLYRRMMMRVAGEIAKREGARAIVTGESLGQVASQTLPNLAVTEDAINLLILRPLIGYDKDEIIDLAKQIGTFEISIEPHDDCCTLFLPKNPSTNARLIDILKEEQKLDIKKLVDDMVLQVEIIK